MLRLGIPTSPGHVVLAVEGGVPSGMVLGGGETVTAELELVVNLGAP